MSAPPRQEFDKKRTNSFTFTSTCKIFEGATCSGVVRGAGQVSCTATGRSVSSHDLPCSHLKTFFPFRTLMVRAKVSTNTFKQAGDGLEPTILRYSCVK